MASGEARQLVICHSQEQLSLMARIFPALEARLANGEWEGLEGRKVFALDGEIAAYAVGYAGKLRYLPEPWPEGATDTEIKAWVKAHAVDYAAGQQIAQLDRASDRKPITSADEGRGFESHSAAPAAPHSPPPVAATATPPVAAEPVPPPPPEGGEPDESDRNVSIAQDALETSQPPDHQIPLSAYENEPEAAKSRPGGKRKPRLRSIMGGIVGTDGNAARKPDPDDEPLPAEMSEDHVAMEFAASQCDDLRYVAARNLWLVWDGSYWKPDAKKEVDRRSIEFCRTALSWPDAASLTPEGRRKIGSKRFWWNMRDNTSSDRRISAEESQFNADPYLLGVPGGVVDLKLGKVIAAEREHYITRQTAVAPERGEPVQWLKFIQHICKGDDSLIAYMQRWCGYFLSGDNSEEALLFCFGPARRGKSKFISALREMMGTYAVTASMDVFTESRMERHSEELASLAGARMIVASETDSNKRWSEARIKQLTGRDIVRARMLRENSFEFQLGKILMAANHIPGLRNVDEAMRRRLHILEFANPVAEEDMDRDLDAKLRTEYPQILQWCMDGFLAWRDAGLGKPEQVMEAVENYLEGEDVIAEWIEANAVVDQNARAKSSDLYANYRSWAEGAGEYVLSQKNFTTKLKERGYQVMKSGVKVILGLRLADAVVPRYGADK